MDPRLTESTRCISRKWSGVELTLIASVVHGGRLVTRETNDHCVSTILESEVSFLKTRLNGTIQVGPNLGQTLLVPAGKRCASEWRGNGRILVASLSIDAETMADHLGQAQPIQSLVPKFYYQDSFLNHIIDYMRTLLSSNDDLSEMMGHTLSRAVCLHLGHGYGDPSAVLPSARGSRLNAQMSASLVDYIQENLRHRITLEDLAAVVNLSVTKLIPAFRTTFALTPAQYVIAQRLSLARRLLANSTLDITAVASEAGFADNSHLTRLFKRTYGLTPSEFGAKAGNRPGRQRKLRAQPKARN
ncbi:AraC family transcriptional regulator [Bradyrhizobium prioriisuperbiae]|uniref:AraC family transcriptional regulator n=1 Tax=Bradyrhizobium prioriisuperbiae TaxID=2854389 RepID=UPI0028ED3E83|nr:AraC family transcriptional regulator [Bradyrhizobium prioritasuperba]